MVSIFINEEEWNLGSFFENDHDSYDLCLIYYVLGTSQGPIQLLSYCRKGPKKASVSIDVDGCKI